MRDDIQNQSEILSSAETCLFLRISKGTLRKLKIPYLKIRRRVLYRKTDIEKFIEENLKGENNDS
jgi:hypothetical protein